jgi:hypothetical protein
MSSIMQSRSYGNAYPIGRFVLARAISLGLSRSVTSPIITANLAEALEADQNLIDAVLIAAVRQKHYEARARIWAREGAHGATFRPHLKVETARRVPSPIFVAALFGVARLRIVPLSHDTFAATVEARDRTIKAAILQHYRETSGRVPAFGRITEYVLVGLFGYDGAAVQHERRSGRSFAPDQAARRGNPRHQARR